MAVEQSTEAATEVDVSGGEDAITDALARRFENELGGEARGRDETTGRFVSKKPPQAEGEAAEPEATDDQDQVEAATEEQPEEVEVEIEGESYLVPKKISDRFIQHADYTRKTQDLAELRRATSAERELFNLNRAFDESVSVERQRLAALDEQIAAYKNVNWSAIEDTAQLVRTRENLNQLKEMRAELANAITAKRTEFDQKIQGSVQEALQAGEKYIGQRIKGYGEETKKQLLSYGVGEGYTQAELDRIMDPRIVVSLWKAMQWDALQASKPGTLKRASQAQPTVRPGASQRQPSRVQALSQKIAKAAPGKAKEAAVEDYLTAKFGG